MKGQDIDSDEDSGPERTEPEEEEEEEASHDKKGMGRLLASNAIGDLATALRRDVNIITFAHVCKEMRGKLIGLMQQNKIKALLL